MPSKLAKPTSATEAVPQIVELLSGLGPDEQKRAVSAAMILLSLSPTGSVVAGDDVQHGDNPEGISTKASGWMKKYGIGADQLGHVFTVSVEEVDVIAASLPGGSKRQKTLEAYVLCGLRSFIHGGEGRFDDKEARALCLKLGCYDPANHSNYMKAFSNLITGSKDIGWRITNPGFERAAQIVKQLTGGTAA